MSDRLSETKFFYAIQLLCSIWPKATLKRPRYQFISELCFYNMENTHAHLLWDKTCSPGKTEKRSSSAAFEASAPACHDCGYVCSRPAELNFIFGSNIYELWRSKFELVSRG